MLFTPEQIRQFVEEGDLSTLVCCKPSVEDVQALLDKYPDKVKEEDKYGYLPLHIAAFYNASAEVINLLLNKNKSAATKKGEYGKLPLHIAVRQKCELEVVKALLDAYPEGAKATDENGCLPLHFALLSNKCKSDVVKALLDAYPEGAKGKIGKGNLPLHIALSNKFEGSIVKALLDAYPDGAREKDEDGMLPIHIALSNKSKSDVVKALLDAYPDGAREKDEDGCLPLHIALSKKFEGSIVKALLDGYPDGVKAKDGDGYLPLHIALSKKFEVDIVTALFDAYPDGAMAADPEGKLPLHLAFEYKYVDDNDESSFDVLDVYKKYPGAYYVADNEGRLLLHYLVQYGYSNFLRTTMFVHRSHLVEAQDKNGKLPLQVAIEHEREVDVVELLFRRHPEGVKTLGKVGKKSFTNAIELKYPVDVLFALLQADMPLDNDGKLIEHDDSWCVCIAHDKDAAVGAVKRILSKDGGNFGKHIHALAESRDSEGRSALGLAKSKARSIIYEYLLFCGWYKLSIGSPEHRTLTSILIRAYDYKERTDYANIFVEADNDKSGTLDHEELKNIATSIGLNPELFLKGSREGECIKKDEFVSICKQQLGDGPREVVIKLMRSKEHWQRECVARRNFNLSPDYVVSMLPNVPSENEISEAVKNGSGGLDIIKEKYLKDIEIGKYAIVMDAADRNLLQIYYQEQPKIDAVRDILRQVFEAVKHLHEKKLMHGDLKMLNIVRMRVNNRLCLIDFDASAEIVPHGEDGESFAGAKFSSAVLPPEMIAKLETGQVDKYNAYWQAEEDEGLKGKVAPKIYTKQGIEISKYVVKSFRTKGGEPMHKGLPYELVDASENIDAWSLGVLAFTLLTGEPLIPSNRDDDCASGAAMHLLYTWGEQPQVLLDCMKKIPDKAARDLVQQLLQRKPEDRPSISNLLESHAFFNPLDADLISVMNENFEKVNGNLESQAKQMEIMNTSIKKLGYESKVELLRTRHILVNCMVEATGVLMPKCFGVFHNKLPEQSKEANQKIVDFMAKVKEDGSGVDFQSKYASLSLSEDGADIALAGELKEYQKQVENGIQWAKRMKDIASKIAKGNTEAAFEIIKSSIEDLIVGGKMYFYLIDELTGLPVQAPGWPLVITTPSDVVPKLLPMMISTMQAMSVLNGAAGLVKMCGFPAPTVPQVWSKGLKESVELLKQDSSVSEFGVVNKEVENGTEENKTVGGKSYREFTDFLRKYDPGLKEGKSGDFAGLRRIGDPEDGTVLWTTLTDPEDIEIALKERAEQCKKEELVQIEYDHEQVMAEGRADESEDTSENKLLVENDESLNLIESSEIQDTLAERGVVLNNARNAFVTTEEIDAMIKAAVAAATKETTTTTGSVYNVKLCSCSIM